MLGIALSEKPGVFGARTKANKGDGKTHKGK